VSFHSAAGLGNVTEDTLKAIMVRLDAIEQNMEPLQPLQMKVVKLDVMVIDHDHQHQALHDALHHVKMVQSALGAPCPQVRAHHGTKDNEATDPRNDFVSTAHKLEFPTAPMIHCHG
jgi:hypothetical protein